MIQINSYLSKLTELVPENVFNICLSKNIRNTDNVSRYVFSENKNCFSFFLGDWHCAYVLLYGPRTVEMVDE